MEFGVRPARSHAERVLGSPYPHTQVVAEYLSTAGHAKSGGKLGRPRPKAKYGWRAIGNEYREGKVKRTPRGE